MVKFNVGSVDALVRIVAGVMTLSLVFWGPRTNWGWLGVIPLVTGLLRYCPFYQLLGLSTAERYHPPKI